uniref:F-box domain-containing protein n=1 Tax=Steinernema glaseri TaxID=37863 RepID=A0A1I7ZT53_9BILA
MGGVQSRRPRVQLNDDVLLTILSYVKDSGVTFIQFYKCRGVCRQWRRVVEHLCSPQVIVLNLCALRHFPSIFSVLFSICFNADDLDQESATDQVVEALLNLLAANPRCIEINMPRTCNTASMNRILRCSAVSLVSELCVTIADDKSLAILNSCLPDFFRLQEIWLCAFSSVYMDDCLRALVAHSSKNGSLSTITLEFMAQWNDAHFPKLIDSSALALFVQALATHGKKMILSLRMREEHVHELFAFPFGRRVESKSNEWITPDKQVMKMDAKNEPEGWMVDITISPADGEYTVSLVSELCVTIADDKSLAILNSCLPDFFRLQEIWLFVFSFVYMDDCLRALVAHSSKNRSLSKITLEFIPQWNDAHFPMLIDTSALSLFVQALTTHGKKMKLSLRMREQHVHELFAFPFGRRIESKSNEWITSDKQIMKMDAKNEPEGWVVDVTISPASGEYSRVM